MTEPQDVLAEALDSTTPQPPDIHHVAVDWRSTSEKAAAILDNLAARGYALVRTPETLDVERLARAIERAGITYPSDRLADPYFLETAEDIAREYVAATPSPAPPEGLHAECECNEMRALEERDAYMDWADRLAFSIAPVDVIGEHSNMNNPWQNAVDHLEGERQIVAARAASPAPDPGAEPENVLATLGKLLCEGRQHEHDWSVCYDSNRLAEYALARGPWDRKGYWRTPEMDRIAAPSAEPPETA